MSHFFGSSGGLKPSIGAYVTSIRINSGRHSAGARRHSPFFRSCTRNRRSEQFLQPVAILRMIIDNQNFGHRRTFLDGDERGGARSFWWRCSDRRGRLESRNTKSNRRRGSLETVMSPPIKRACLRLIQSPTGPSGLVRASPHLVNDFEEPFPVLVGDAGTLS